MSRVKEILSFVASVADRPEAREAIKSLWDNATKGGPGSGFFGHAGRPGHRGGSAQASASPAKPAQAKPGATGTGGGGGALPKDLTKLTERQHEQAIAKLAKLKLRELRKRQDQVSSQMRIATEQGNESAYRNLQVMEQHLTEAVLRREFGVKEAIESLLGYSDKGGPGSGHHGHRGRPGHRGGSSPGGGGKVTTQVGITSYREGKPLAQVEADMGRLEDALKAAGAEDIQVQLGTGGWEGGEEPTFVTSYKDGVKLYPTIAKMAQEWNQDGVLIMKQTPQGKDPQMRLSLSKPLDRAGIEAVQKKMVKEGLGGWTWGHDSQGRMLLVLQHIPQWTDMTPDQHRQAARSVFQWMKSQGRGAAINEIAMDVTIMERGNYDDYIT